MKRPCCRAKNAAVLEEESHLDDDEPCPACRRVWLLKNADVCTSASLNSTTARKTPSTGTITALPTWQDRQDARPEGRPCYGRGSASHVGKRYGPVEGVFPRRSRVENLPTYNVAIFAVARPDACGHGSSSSGGLLLSTAGIFRTATWSSS